MESHPPDRTSHPTRDTSPHADRPTVDAGRTGSAPDDRHESRANIARVYDAWLGGTENLPVDQVLAAEIAEKAPWVPLGARANRAFLERTVEFLSRVGVDQFLDIGTGLPTARNVHQVARDIVPDAKVVYVDNDPVVVSHSRELLAGEEHVTALTADARDPRTILARAADVGGLDISRPVALLFVAVLHFLNDEDDPAGVLKAFQDALAPGSFLVVSHVTPVTGHNGPAMRRAIRAYQERSLPFVARNRDEILRLFGDWELVPPGLVETDQWRPVTKRRAEARVPALGAVARLVP